MRKVFSKVLAVLVAVALLTGVMPVVPVYANTSSYLMVASGNSRSFALRSDGTVWAWGSNRSGQLGDGTTINRYTPVQVQNLSDVVAVTAGEHHSLALKSDGTLWAWGDNYHGQLGDGTTTDRHTPVQVQNLSDVIAVAAGSYHSLALKSDGTVWAWGNNCSGQLGDGTTTDRHTPVQVQNLSDVIAVAAGGYHSLALKSDGTVWAWGSNCSGQLGDGTTTDRHTPVQVQNLSDVIAVAAGYYYSLAVKSDGTLWTWGDNSYGVLGDGTTTDRHIPVQVQNLSDVVTITSGGYHSLAVKSNSTVWAWGWNKDGQLGDGTTTDRYTPVQVQNLSDVMAVTAGRSNSLALKSDGTVWVWGDGDYYGCNHTPVQVDLPMPISAPIGLEVTASDKDITLQFDPVNGANGYKIERSTDGSNFTEIADIGTTTNENGKVEYNETVPSWDTTYYYRVKAYNDSATSDPSEIVSVTTGSFPAPTGLEITAVDKEVTLKFNPVNFAIPANAEVQYSDITNLDQYDNSYYQYWVVYSYNGGTYLVFSSVKFYYDSSCSPPRLCMESYGDFYRYALYGSDWVYEYYDVDVKKSFYCDGIIDANFDVLDASGAAGYKIERSTDGNNWAVVSDITDPVFENGKVKYVETVPQPGMTYYYRVIAYDDNNYESEASEPVFVTIEAIPVPTLVSVNAIGKDVELKIKHLPDVDGYSVERRVPGGTFAEVKYVENTDPDAYGYVTIIDDTTERETEYEYRVKSKIGTDYSDPSAIKSVITGYGKPDKPTGVQAEWTENGVRITWDTADDRFTYKIQIKGSGDYFTYLAYDVTGNEYIHQTRDQYTYRVIAVYNHMESDPSDEVVPVGDPPLDAPRYVTADATHNTVILTWTPVDGAVSYIVEKMTGVDSFEEVATTSNNSVIIEGLTPETTYGFRVKAAGNPLNKPSQVRTVTTSPAPPEAVTNLQAEVNGTKVTLTWDENANARRYLVERYKGGEYERKTWALKNSFTDSYLEYSTTYTYKVYAYGYGLSDPAEITVTTGEKLKPAPANFRVIKVTDTSVTLAWDTVDGAANYTVKRTVDMNNFTELSPVTETEFTDTGLEPQTTYYYKVKADNSEESRYVKVTTAAVPPEGVTNLQAEVTGNRVTLTWDEVEGVTYYKVKRFLNGELDREQWVRGNVFEDKYLEYSTEYTYEVYARKDGALSEPREITVTTEAEPKPAPENFRVTGVTDTTVSLAWDAVEGAESYTVIRTSNDLQNQTKFSSVTGTEFTDTGLEPQTTYYYKVKADNSRESKYIRATTTSVPPDPAADLQADVVGNKITLTWSEVDGAGYYKVERYRNGELETSRWTRVNSFVDKYLEFETEYTYKVYARNGGALSSPQEITVTTEARPKPAPANFKATNVTDTSATLTWDAVEGAESYIITRTVDRREFVQLGPVTGTEFTDTGLQPETTYYYKVRANNSEESRYIRVTTTEVPPDAVTNLRADVKGNTVTLTWDAVDGVSYYKVERYLTGELNYQRYVSGITYTDKYLEYATGYTYKVYAKGRTALSTPQEIQVTTGPATPQFSYEIDSGQVKLTITCETENVTFKIERGPSLDNMTVIATGVTDTYTDTGVEAYTRYYYRVTAVDENGRESIPARRGVYVY